jgi:hypothetical protein
MLSSVEVVQLKSSKTQAKSIESASNDSYDEYIPTYQVIPPVVRGARYISCGCCCDSWGHWRDYKVSKSVGEMKEPKRQEDVDGSCDCEVQKIRKLSLCVFSLRDRVCGGGNEGQQYQQELRGPVYASRSHPDVKLRDVSLQSDLTKPTEEGRVSFP